MATFTYNPVATTNSNNNFVIDSNRHAVGALLNYGSIASQISSGINKVDTVLYPGTPISANIGTTSTGEFSPVVAATTAVGIVGFTIVDINGMMIPGSNVPAIYQDMQTRFVRFGTGAQLALPIDASITSSISQKALFTYDFTTKMLQTTTVAADALPIQILSIGAGSVVSTTGSATYVNGNIAIVLLTPPN